MRGPIVLCLVYYRPLIRDTWKWIAHVGQDSSVSFCQILMSRSAFHFAEHCVIFKAYGQRRSTASECVCRVFVCRMWEDVCMPAFCVLHGLVDTACSLIVGVHS